MKTSIMQAAKVLSSLEIWVVSTVVLLSMLRTDLLPWAMLIAAFFWPIRWIANGRPSLRTPADLSNVLLLLMIPVTLWATALPEKTIPQVYRLVLGILFFYTIINWTGYTKKLGWIFQASSWQVLGWRGWQLSVSSSPQPNCNLFQLQFTSALSYWSRMRSTPT